MKKKFSKILGLALALAMVMAMLSACGGGDNGSGSGSDSGSGGGSDKGGETKGKIAYIVGNLGDKSFSDSGKRAGTLRPLRPATPPRPTSSRTISATRWTRGTPISWPPTPTRM